MVCMPERILSTQMERRAFCSKKDSLIAQGVIKEDGTLDFSELYLGKMYVKEITPPEGYTVDPTEYEVTPYLRRTGSGRGNQGPDRTGTGEETGVPAHQDQ